MNITYYVEQVISKSKRNTVHTTNSLKKAIDYFQYHCEINPQAKFRLTKIETIKEVIAESNDYRQKTFEFV